MHLNYIKKASIYYLISALMASAFSIAAENTIAEALISETTIRSLDDFQNEILNEYANLCENETQNNQHIPFEHQWNSLDNTLVEELINNSPARLKTLINRFILSRSLHQAERNALITDKLLLVGPPGVGKSDLAKAIAQKINRPYIFLKSSLLATEYQNSGAQNLQRIISEVKNTQTPYVIIFDEMNCLVDQQKNNQRSDQDPAVALWQLIDECSQSNNILFIGTTNTIEHMPEALKSRFYNAIIHIDLPNTTAREKIFTYYFSASMDRGAIAYMAKMTSDLSARELKELIKEMQALALENGGIVPTITEFNISLNELKQSKLLFETKWHAKMSLYVKSNALPLAHFTLGVIGLGLQIKSLFNR